MCTKRTHRVFFAELAEFAAELSEFSLFRNSTLETVFCPFPSSFFPSDVLLSLVIVVMIVVISLMPGVNVAIRAETVLICSPMSGDSYLSQAAMIGCLSHEQWGNLLGEREPLGICAFGPEPQNASKADPSRLGAAIQVSVFHERMGDRSRFLFCDPMCDRNHLGPN